MDKQDIGILLAILAILISMELYVAGRVDSIRASAPSEPAAAPVAQRGSTP